MKLRLPYLGKVMIASILSILFVGVAATFASDFGLAEVSDSGLAISNDFSIIEIIARIIRILLGLLGIIVLGLFLYAGFTWMTANGNAEKIETAKKIMTNAVIGLVIIFSSFAITQFVINRLAEATGSNGTTITTDPPPRGSCDPRSVDYDEAACEEFCRLNPLDSICFDRDFYVTSITPSTENDVTATNMNNIQVRVIFSRPITRGVIDNAVTLTKDGAVVPTTPVLHPHTRAMISLVPEKDLENGTYTVEVNDELVDATGELIETSYTDRRGYTYRAETEFTVNRDFEDDRRPEFETLTLDGTTGEPTVFIGDVLEIALTSQDRDTLPPYGGIGYADIRMVTDGPIQFKVLGPRVRDASGDKYGSSEEFSTTYSQAITSELYTAGQRYRAHVSVRDIQSDSVNTNVATARWFTVYEWHCNNGYQDEDETGIDTGGSCGGDGGDLCVVDADCSPYMRCIEGACVPTPVILGIDPTDAADGNWVTVLGRYFGDETGTVEFGVQQEDETFEWVTASQPGRDICPVGDLWQDEWIIVTVPTSGTGGVTFETGDIAAIRVVTSGGSVTSDITMDDTVNDRGPQTRFTKSVTNRPGLCAVLNDTTSRNVGESGNGTNWYGQGFISGLTSPVWGGIFGEVSSFSSANLLASVVPNGIQNGRIGVYVQEGETGPKSNGIPFFIENPSLVENPVITNIDPEKTTNGSFVTLSGSGFGTSTGVVYLAETPEIVQTCAAGATDGCKVLVVDLEQQCEDTWRDTEVIVQISDAGDEIEEGRYALLLRTATGRATDGTDILVVNDGPPLPSICSISPNTGPAPLAGDNLIEIAGTNFGEKAEHDLRFWDTGASTTDPTFTGWLGSADDATGDTIDTYENILISSRLPVHQSGVSEGLSIPLNIPVPIRVQDTTNGTMSNAVSYTANVCDPANDTANFHCCTEGADAGRLRPTGTACAGQTRSAGYTWRFASGVIPRVPYVLEQCEVGSLPTPSPLANRETGEQVCLNALVVVQFSETMDATTISPDSVRMFACERERGACSDVNLVTSESLQFDGNNVLRIYNGADTPLDTDTWYSVEIDTTLTSYVTEIVSGFPVVHRESLRATADCGADTAYCFDFKTSEVGATCNIESAYIVPGDKTVTALGPLEVYEGRLQQFQVYGQADQECIALDVRDLAWSWGAYGTLSDIIQFPALSQISIDELLNPRNDIKTLDIQNDVVAQPVKLLAEFTNNLEGVIQNGLCETGPSAGSECSADAACEEANTCVPTLRLSQCSPGAGVYNGVCLDSSSCAAGETCIENPSSVANGICSGGDRDGMACLTRISAACTGGGTCEPLETVGLCEGTTDSCLVDADCTIEHVCTQEFEVDTINTRSVTGTSTILITLGDPALSDFYPNCAAACTNATLGVQFNRNMITSTFEGVDAVQLFTCTDETCTSTSTAPGGAVGVIDITPRGFVITPGSPLVRDQWYQVELADTITSIGGYSNLGEILPGDAIETFTWRFKTKDTFDGCFISTIDVAPDGYVARAVGEQNVFSVFPYGTPDVCSPYGQQLNPWDYDWDWNIEDVYTDAGTVAELTNFAQSPTAALGCTESCLPTGSTVPLDAGSTFVCGNNIIEPGETCEIGNNRETAGGLVDIFAESGAFVGQGYAAGTTCTYSCQRPGNGASGVITTEELCGNGVLDNPIANGREAGEECDDGNTINGDGCSDICVNEGSRFELVTGEVEGGLCNGEIVTFGEECEIINATTVAIASSTSATGSEQFTVTDASAFCSDTCLMPGTPIAAEWCAAGTRSNLDVCAAPATVCGNGVLEVGEQCEYDYIGGAADKTYIRGLADSIAVDPAVICSNRCVIKNACAVSTGVPIAAIPSEITCLAGTEGCTDQCTLAGSSIHYSTPSLCGDGLLGGDPGIGENAACEITPVAGEAFTSPVQIATAIGESTEIAPETGSQQAVITVSADRYTELDGVTVSSFGSGEITSETADYFLQCGYTEYVTPETISDTSEVLEYNNCNGSDNGYTSGVAENSCCYPRPVGDAYYPVDFETNVCRNTLITATFVGEVIDESTIQNNILIAEHTPGACADARTDITEQVQNVFAVANVTKDVGFFGKIWDRVKTIFARLMPVVLADHPISVSTGSWCDTGIALDTEILYEVGATGEDGTIIPSSVTSTIQISVQELLKEHTNYSVLLKSTANGIANYRGIPIQAKDNTSVYDAWVFQTGFEVCKIASVEVLPASHVFTAPETTSTFHIFANTQRDERIVPIAGVYSWVYDWAPQSNPLFDIPYEGSVESDMDNTAEIRVRDREGELTALGTVEIVEDSTPIDSGNQLGNTFIGTTNLYGIFCAQIWPRRAADTWAPYSDAGFNYQFSYCADAGLSSTTTDDLPYFNVPAIEPTLTRDSFGFCTAGMTDSLLDSCDEDIDCGGTISVAGICEGLGEVPVDGATCEDVVTEAGKCIGVGELVSKLPGEGHCQYTLRHIGTLPGDRTHDFPLETCSEVSDCEVKTVLHPDFETTVSRFGDICSETKGRCATDTDRAGEVCAESGHCWEDGAFHALGDCFESLTSEVSSVAEDGAPYCLVGNNVSKVYRGISCGSNEECDVPVDVTCADIGEPTILDTPTREPGTCNTTGDSCLLDEECEDTIECVDIEAAPATTGRCNTTGAECTSDGACDATDTIAGVCSPTTPSDEILDRKIFLNDTNDDALGIQIFKNTDRQSARNWYEDRFNDGSSYQSLSIDGYDAITNGYNYFVNALNVSYTSLGAVIKIFNNVYQFTINESAQNNTQQAFEQIIENLEFNTNVSDYGYCLVDGLNRRSTTVDFGAPEDELACATDFDCRDSNGDKLAGKSGYCSNNRTALLRDFERVQEIQLIQGELEQHKLDNGTYPTLAAGSYYPGYTVSRWPSWRRLQQDIVTLPTDPINQWTDCGDLVGTDQETCWDATASTYYCPVYSSVYEYKVDNAAATEYTFHAPLEYLSSTEDPFVASFITLGDFSSTAWCEGASVSPAVGICGDGIVQEASGEDCDPAGERVDNSCNSGAGTQSQVCTAECTLEFPLWGIDDVECISGVDCGNGRVETGEICDDGALNGTYGHCSTTCDFASANYCGDGDLDTPHELCDYADVDQNLGVCSNVRSASCSDDSDCAAIMGDCIARDDPSYGNRTWHDNDGSLIRQFFIDVAAGNPTIDTEALYADFLVNFERSTGVDVVTNANIYSCNTNCTARGNYCGDGIVQSEYEACDDGNFIDTDSCTNRCSVNSTPVVSADEYAGTCGDGIIQSPNADSVEEVCDLGIDANGVRPTNIPYGESLTYCSADCREVLTADPIAYCGDGIVQENERCDVQVTAGVTQVYAKQCKGGGSGSDTFNDSCLSDVDCEDGNTCRAPVLTACSADYGAYQCLNDCQLVVNDCTSCGQYSFKGGNANLESERDIERWFYGDRHPEGAIPKLALLNPLIAGNPDYKDSDQSRDTTNSSYEGTDLEGGVISDWWGKTKTSNLNNDGSFLSFFKWNDIVNTNPTYMGYTNFTNQYIGDVDDSGSPITRDSQSVDPNYYNFMFYFSPSGGATSDSTGDNYNFTHSMFTTIETDAYCSEDYKIVFNSRRIGEARHDNARDTNALRDVKTLVNDGFTDAFEYPVTGESAFVNNTIVTSPAVPKETLRVVVRSKKQPSESVLRMPVFTLSAYSPVFTGASPRISYDATPSSNRCNNMVRTNRNVGTGTATFSGREEDDAIANKVYTVEINTTTINPTFLTHYWWPKTSGANSCTGQGGTSNKIFVHDVGHTEDGLETIQSFTIDANQIRNGAVVPISVTAIGRPVQPYQTREDVVVEVYEYHENQVPGYSLYKPTQTFTISAADQSSNPLAPYWHVFNLIPDDSDTGYSIDTVGADENGSIETRWSNITAIADGTP